MSKRERGFSLGKRIASSSNCAILVSALVMGGCAGGGEAKRGEMPATLQPQTTVVLSEAGETLADVSHRTGFALAVLESLNPGRVGQKLPAGVGLRCPVGQPGIRNVETRP